VGEHAGRPLQFDDALYALMMVALVGLGSSYGAHRIDRILRWSRAVATVSANPTHCLLVVYHFRKYRPSERSRISCESARQHASDELLPSSIEYDVPIAFQAADGRTRSLTVSSANLGVGSVALGDEIPILYDPNAPENVDGLFTLGRDYPWLLALPAALSGLALLWWSLTGMNLLATAAARFKRRLGHSEPDGAAPASAFRSGLRTATPAGAKETRKAFGRRAVPPPPKL
jgi:hypothetical protein